MGAATSPLQQREAEDHADRPHRHQEQQRERAVEAEKVLSPLWVPEHRRRPTPDPPRRAEVDPGEAEPAGDPAGKDERLEGIPEHHEDGGNAKGLRQGPHLRSVLRGS